jgi:hypothetical protein
MASRRKKRRNDDGEREETRSAACSMQQHREMEYRHVTPLLPEALAHLHSPGGRTRPTRRTQTQHLRVRCLQYTLAHLHSPRRLLVHLVRDEVRRVGLVRLVHHDSLAPGGHLPAHAVVPSRRHHKPAPRAEGSGCTRAPQYRPNLDQLAALSESLCCREGRASSMHSGGMATKKHALTARGE